MGAWLSFLTAAFLNLGISVPPLTLDGDFLNSILIRSLLLIPAMAAWIVVHVWCFGAIWRSAVNVADSIWTARARVSLFVLGAVWLPFLLANALWQIAAQFNNP